ncbi:MAG: hypothetical protein N2445_01895 [Acidobacteria bacterium]|nr:hypothetical protein [Acidobacteriota bacterium]
MKIKEVTYSHCEGVLSTEDERLKLNSKKIVPIPDCSGLIFPLVSVVPLQLLAYYASVERGFDPDFPRNLSKTLTVD